MKIPTTIRSLYEEQIEFYRRFGKEVDRKIKSSINRRWHYESRIKNEQSFALKIETGRFSEVNRLEDFFACTIVVENQNEIKNALKLVKDCNFFIRYKRPASSRFTYKKADTFSFDDLRLYVEWQDNPTVRPTGFIGTLFEIQIKTYLQHAWAIATHDLVYKSDSVSWSKQRIAYQIKAMLEHAEIAIAEAEELSRCVQVNKEDKYTKKLVSIIKLIKSYWKKNQLPNDLTRLADSVNSLITSLNINIYELKKIMDKETKDGRGAKLLNLSPYGSIVQSIIKVDEKRIQNFLDDNDSKFRLLLTNEMDIPESLIIKDSEKIIFID